MSGIPKTSLLLASILSVSAALARPTVIPTEQLRVLPVLSPGRNLSPDFM